MTYRVSYIDTSTGLASDRSPSAVARTENYPSEPAALGRARELLQNAHCHRVLVSDGEREPVGGVCLQLKLGLTGD